MRERIKKYWMILIVMVLVACVQVSGSASPVTIPTDVSLASPGNIILGIRGKYICQIQEALDRINEIRYEACKEGVINPSSGRPLTLSDYCPIKWSADLEYIARIRAAEAAVTIAHVRTNGTRCFNLRSPRGIQSTGEILAWNWGKSMIKGIEQWYEEKYDWIWNTGRVTGHYTQMIDPQNKYIGMATFCSEDAKYYNSTAGEFSRNSFLDETRGNTIEDCIQLIEVNNNFLTNQYEIKNLGLDDIVKGSVTQLALTTGMVFTDDDGSIRTKGLIMSDVNWTSSSPEIAIVSSEGTVNALQCGKTDIMAGNGNTNLARYSFTVNHNPAVENAVPATPGASGKTEGKYCSVCGMILKKSTPIAQIQSLKLYKKKFFYNGKVQKPSIKVLDSNGKVIKASNYSIKYSSRPKKKGTYKVTITFKGKYAGKMEAHYSIEGK